MGCATWQFDGETAVVTGGNSGIGRQIALAFADAGGNVIIADIKEESVDPDAAPTHETIEDEGGNAVFVKTDVRDPADQLTAIEQAQEFGGLNVMFNNAGVGEFGIGTERHTRGF